MILKTYTFFLAIIGISLMTVPANAQMYDSLYKASIGIIGGAGFSMHSVDFRTLPGIPSCCPQYTSGTGTGFIAGISFDYPLSDVWLLDIRATLHKQNARLVTQERKTVFDGTQSVDGIFEHSIDADIPLYAITPSIRYIIKDNINVRVGMNIGFFGTAKYVQEEILSSPTNLVFSNGSSVWLSSSGEIPMLNTLQLSALTSIGYDIPLNQSRTFVATPEISYTIGFTDVLQTNPWKIQTISAGIGLRYIFREDPPLPPMEFPNIQQTETAITLNLEADAASPKQQSLRGTIRGIIIDSNGKQLNPQIFRVNNIISTNITALVNSIFFDPESVEIPNRYIQLSSNEAERFDLSVLDGAGTLGVYYQILNVLAKRMIAEPTSTITLTGCLSGSESEKDQMQLAQQRAENVKNYLTAVWQIEPKRINVKYRNLPEVPSNTNNDDGFAENRRVEISTTSQEILNVLSFMDTTRTTNVAKMNIAARAQSEESIEEWSIIVNQGTNTLKEFTDIGEIPSSPLVWNINEDKENIPRGKGLLSLSLFARDRDGKKLRIDGSPIVVEQLYNQKERIETYALITFKYNESTVDESNMAIVELIKSRISPNSIVTIEGYTDRIGNPDYNLKLSDRRAKEVARLLKLPSDIAVGKGNSNILYNNDLPEGRIYSRTVRVTIETPIE